MNKFKIPDSGFNKVLAEIKLNSPSTDRAAASAITQKRLELEKNKRLQGWIKNEYGQWQKIR